MRMVKGTLTNIEITKNEYSTGCPKSCAIIEKQFKFYIYLANEIIHTFGNFIGLIMQDDVLQMSSALAISQIYVFFQLLPDLWIILFMGRGRGRSYENIIQRRKHSTLHLCERKHLLSFDDIPENIRHPKEVAGYSAKTLGKIKIKKMKLFRNTYNNNNNKVASSNNKSVITLISKLLV